MKRIYLFLTVLTMTLCSAVAQTGDPIFTFGCLSDIHSQESMISASDVSNVKLRTAFTTSLQKIKESEKVDALVLGGDYTSDVTISETNWQKVRSLMGEAVLTAFPDGATRTPVIYTVGNHDFEVPYIHNPIKLAQSTGLMRQFSEEQVDFLTSIVPLNIEARYPDYKAKVGSGLNKSSCKYLIDQTICLQNWIKERL